MKAAEEKQPPTPAKTCTCKPVREIVGTAEYITHQPWCALPPGRHTEVFR